MVRSDESELITGLAELFGQRLEAVGADIVDAIVQALPLLGDDPAIRTELLTHTMWNVRSFLAAVRSGDEPSTIAAPPEMKAIARSLVHRGIEPDVAYEGYRLAEQIAWKQWMELTADQVAPADLVEVLQVSHSVLSEFIEEMMHRAIEAMREEQSQIAGGDQSRRIKMVRILLDGVRLDDEMVSRSLRYDIRREHTALVIWAESAVPPKTLKSAGSALARAINAPTPLMISAAEDVLWVWIATATVDDANPIASAAADLIEAPLRLAIGPTVSGLEGFRRSHEGAVAVQRLSAANPPGARILTYRELEVAAMVSGDETRARDFVLHTLGSLADDTPAAARLRETLRVYLEEADNAPRSAERLHTHRNTVLQRVAKATELLGYAPGERRLAVELALELRRWLPIPP